MTLSKKQKVIYWVCTVLVAAMNLMAAFGLLMGGAQNVEGMVHLGYPLYFMHILGTAKLLGSISLVYRKFPNLTDWAYAGFTFTFLGASYSHFSSGDGAVKTIVPLVFTAILHVSYHYWKLSRKRSS